MTDGKGDNTIYFERSGEWNGKLGSATENVYLTDCNQEIVDDFKAGKYSRIKDVTIQISAPDSQKDKYLHWTNEICKVVPDQSTMTLKSCRHGKLDTFNGQDLFKYAHPNVFPHIEAPNMTCLMSIGEDFTGLEQKNVPNLEHLILESCCIADPDSLDKLESVVFLDMERCIDSTRDESVAFPVGSKTLSRLVKLTLRIFQDKTPLDIARFQSNIRLLSSIEDAYITVMSHGAVMMDLDFSDCSRLKQLGLFGVSPTRVPGSLVSYTNRQGPMGEGAANDRGFDLKCLVGAANSLEILNVEASKFVNLGSLLPAFTKLKTVRISLVKDPSKGGDSDCQWHQSSLEELEAVSTRFPQFVIGKDLSCHL